MNVSTLFLVAVFTALVSWVANGQESGGAAYLGPHAEGKFTPAPAHESIQSQRRLLTSRFPAMVVLDRVETAALRAESASQSGKSGVPLKIGFSRDVPILSSKSQTAAVMAWTWDYPGQFAAINLTSPEALGIRLGLLGE